MKSDLKTYRRQLDKFNRWEVTEKKAKSEKDLLEEFLILFNLIDKMPDEVVRNGHDSHLRNLIQVQKRLSTKAKGQREKGNG